jgi:DNA gyrase/topoisomerase IV, subunit A
MSDPFLGTVRHTKFWLSFFASSFSLAAINAVTLTALSYCMFFIFSLVDGLKPGQRKVIFTCLKRNLTKKEIKVAQLSGSVAEVRIT